MNLSHWHERRPTADQRQHFLRLKELHALLHAWVSDLGAGQDRPSYSIPRFAALEGQDPLSLVERLSQSTEMPSLESLLRDLTPQEGLERLEHSLWLAISWTLQELKKQAPEAEWPGIMNLLQQTAWKTGRLSCLTQWPAFPEDAREDLRSFLPALQTSGLGRPHPYSAFLQIRHTQTRAEIAWLNCPHQSPWPEVRAHADLICELLSHWLRGWTYALSTRAQGRYIARATPQEYCQLQWEFP